MQAPKDRYIRVGQVNTRYWAEGEQGSTVLLLHGVGSYIERWLPSFGPLAGQHRVYAVDLLGHGRTDKPPSASYSWEDFAQFVRDFMRGVAIERANLVGLSMGGAIALTVALRYPAMVGRLVLVGSAGLGKETPLEFRLASVPLLGELLARPSRKASAQGFKTNVYNQSVVTDELIDLAYRMAAQPGAQQALLKIARWAFSPFGPRECYYVPILRGLPAISNPTLIVWGRQDRLVPVAHAQAAARVLPNARLHILDECGHLPMLDKTEQFNSLLMDFLAD